MIPQSAIRNPQSVHLVVVRNPFDRSIRDERSLPMDDTLTVARIVAEYLPVSAELSVAIDGEVITREEWESRTIMPGEQLVVMPLVHKGGGDLLGMVLMVAVVVMAPYLAAAIAPSLGIAAGGIGMSLLTVGISMVGSMIVGGLMAPSRPGLPGAGTGTQSYNNSPAYSWNPATTQQPGGAVARAYGRFKLYGNIISGYTDIGGSTGQNQTAHLLIDLGTGPYNSLSDFRINDQPVANYTGVTVTSRLGYLNQTAIQAFNDTRATHSIGAKVVSGSPIVRDTIGTDYDALEIVMVAPNGLWYANDAGGLDSLNVNVTVEVSADGGATWYYQTPVFLGATQQPIRQVVRFANLPRGTRCKVRCTNLSADQTTSRYGDDIYLSDIIEVMYDDFQYPRTVLVAINALATNQLSGSIKFSCIGECAIIRVWSGSAWASQWSNNPAWVCWDILTQPVLGNNLNVVRYDGMNPSRLVLSSFKTWADFCDAQVSDGRGGMEVRCTFNGLFDTSGTMWDAALEVCASARAQLVMRGTRITVVVDDVRATPSQLFSVGNTAVSGFHETFLPMQDRAASIEVGFTDELNNYQRDAVTVVNTAITASAAARTQIGLRGVTRASQAWREANFKLKRNELLKRSASISVDIDALACTVGDLIWLQSDVTSWGVGGRAAAGSSTTRLMLDHDIVLDAVKTYELKLRLDDDTLVSRTITTAAGTVSAVDVSVAFPSAPTTYAVWAIGETNKAVKEFIVLDIQRDSDQRAKLSLIEYNASLYGLDSGIPAQPTPDISAPVVPSVSNVRVIEVMELSAGGVIVVHLDIYFDMADAKKVDFYGDGVLIGESSIGIFRRSNVTSGKTYNFSLHPFGLLGVSPSSTWRSVSHAVVGKLAPPLDVSGFVATRNGNDLYFNWAANAELDVAGYEIRLGSSWDTAVSIGKEVNPRTAMATVSPQGGTFLIKAFDTCMPKPNYSVTAAQCILSANSNINVVLTDDDALYGWPGVLSGMVKSGLVLNLGYTNTWADWTLPWSSYQKSWMAESGPLSAGSYVSELHDIGQVLSCNLYITPDVSVVALGQTWDSWTQPWAYYANNWTWEGPLGTITAVYEIDTSLDNIAWTGWQLFAPGLRTLRYYKLRVSFTALPNYQIQFNHFAITVDVPDRVERYANQAVPSGGLHLDFTPPFNAVDTIKVNLLNGLSGDRYTISNKTAGGVDINVYDNALAAKAGVLDVEIFGY